MLRLCTWLACAVLVAAPLAAQEATLSLQVLSAGQVAPGDTLVVGVYVDAGALELTSASAYLRCDPSLLQILSQSSNQDGTVIPFISGAAWTATVYENAGDPLTGELSYVAVSSADASGTRAVASGRFMLASVYLRVVGMPADGRVDVSLDAGGRRQSTYTLSAEPGVEQRFILAERALTIDVVGEGFVPLPDRIVAAHQPWTVDLADYYSGPLAAVVAWGAVADAGIDLQREGSLLRAEAAVEGSVRYWADVDDGRRYARQFAVYIVAEPVYMREGGLIEIEEDGGPNRMPFSEFMLDGEAVGHFAAWAEDGAAVRVEEDGLVIEPAPDWAGQTEFSLRFCAVDGTCQTERWRLLVRGHNDPPVLADMELLELVAGQRQVLPLASIVADVDDDLDELVVEASPSALVQIVRQGDALVVEALAVGDGEVVLRAVDRAGAEGTVVWAVRVRAPSAGPHLAAEPDLRVVVGEAVVLDLSAYVEDADSALEDLAWTLRGEGIDAIWLDEAASTVELYAAEEGEAVLYVQVRDRQGNEATAAWPIAVEAVAEDLEASPSPPPPDEETAADAATADAEAVDGVEPLPAEGDGLPEEGADASDWEDPAEEDAPDGDTADAPDGTQSLDGGNSPQGETADPTVAADAETAQDSTEAVQSPEGQQVDAGGNGSVEEGEDVEWNLLPMEPMQLRAGASWSVDLSPHVEGIDPETLVWSAVGEPGIAVSIAGSRAVLQVDARSYGRLQLLFSAVDGSGQQRSLSLVVEVVVPWSLGDIPDVELVQGDSLFIDLSEYVDADVVWSVSGGEGLVIEWTQGGVQLSAEEGFSGRSALIFTALDEAGFSAADAVRVEVRLGAAVESAGGTAEANGAAPGDEQEVELALSAWGDVALAQGMTWTTPPLDELVLSGHATDVQWSLRGGAFVVAHIDSARRVVLNGEGARVGREVFWLAATWNGQRREVALGVQVSAREPTLSAPDGEVLATADGYDLVRLLDGDASGVQWSGEAIGARAYVEGGLLYVEAEPGLYAVALAAHLPSGRSLRVDLSVRVPAGQTAGDAVEEVVEEAVAAVDPPQAPAFDMPVSIEVERGMGGRWPLRIVDGDSPRAELNVSLSAVGGNAYLDAEYLVVEDVLEAFFIVLRVRDGQGLSDSLRIAVEPRDTVPPAFELSAQIDGTGRVRWTLIGDEALATALLMLDEQPLPHRERTERRVVWEHIPPDQAVRRLRVLAGDAAGNVAAQQLDISVGWAGSGRAVHSADGRLRVLAGRARVHVLVYAEADAYRIECADAERLEISLRAEQTDAGLEYGQVGAWQALPTVASNELLRARVDGPGWLRSGGLRAEQMADLSPVAFPNPFNAAVTVRLEMAVAGWLQVGVFDVLGRRVRALLAEERAAGPWTAQWDGRDGRGLDVASGSYLIVVNAAGVRQVVPVMLIR